MTQAMIPDRQIPSASQPALVFAPPRGNDHMLRRFKALVEPSPGPVPDALPPPLPKTSGSRQQTGSGDVAFAWIGEKAQPPVTPSQAPVSASAGQGERIAEARHAAELALGLEHAHARPTATQLLLSSTDVVIVGATIAQPSSQAPFDIALIAGTRGLAADALETLRRRLAARGLLVGQIHFAEAEEVTRG